MKKKIYFDLDGTLFAYHQAVEKLVPDLAAIQCEKEYYDKVIEPWFGTDLFSSLEPLPLYHYLTEFVDNYPSFYLDNEVVFVSFVGHHEHTLNSIRHKNTSLYNWGISDYGPFIPLIGSYEDRALLADKNSFLFDDHEYTIELFRKNGGQGMVVQPYETNITQEGYEIFSRTLDTFLES